MQQFRPYLKMLQSGWWIIALSALSALVIALVLAYTATPLYRASARFIISPNADITTGRDVVSSLVALDKRTIASTYAEILDSDRVYEEASEQLQVESSALKGYTLKTVVLPEANILELSATGPDPNVAAMLANSVGKQGMDYVSNLYQVYTVTFLDPAKVPRTPVSPKPDRDASLALVLGLVIGAVLAIIRGLVGPTVQGWISSGLLHRRNKQPQPVPQESPATLAASSPTGSDSKA